MCLISREGATIGADTGYRLRPIVTHTEVVRVEEGGAVRAGAGGPARGGAAEVGEEGDHSSAILYAGVHTCVQTAIARGVLHAHQRVVHRPHCFVGAALRPGCGDLQHHGQADEGHPGEGHDNLSK